MVILDYVVSSRIHSCYPPDMHYNRGVADIRGVRDKHSSVRLYHLLTWRHTPHPHCPPSVGMNIFPQSQSNSHVSWIKIIS